MYPLGSLFNNNNDNNENKTNPAVSTVYQCKMLKFVSRIVTNKLIFGLVSYSGVSIVIGFPALSPSLLI